MVNDRDEAWSRWADQYYKDDACYLDVSFSEQPIVSPETESLVRVFLVRLRRRVAYNQLLEATRSEKAFLQLPRLPLLPGFYRYNPTEETYMATKNNPSEYDCHGAAAPDEPYFTFLARDRHAPLLIRLWAEMRRRAGEDPAKVAEALTVASDMELYRAEELAKPGMNKVLETDLAGAFAGVLSSHTVTP